MTDIIHKDARDTVIKIGDQVVFVSLKSIDNFSFTTMRWGNVSQIKPQTINITTPEGEVFQRHPHKVVVANLPD